MRQFLRAGAFLVAMVTATGAFAASALVTTDLNLRTGPGSGYGRITTMPDGAIVDVRGCTRGYSWCRVNWNGYDGWAYSDYLAAQSNRRRTYDSYGASIGIPLIAGVIIGGALNDNDHHDYDRRDYRRDHRNYRPRRVERRHERRVERRQERRAERRHDRRVEKRQERRTEKRQERRAEKRQERRAEKRKERRVEKRKERRKERRAERRNKRQDARAERRDNRQERRAERRGNARAVDRCPGGYRRQHGNC